MVQYNATSSASVEVLALMIRIEFHGYLDVVLVNSAFSGPLIPKLLLESPVDFKKAFEVNVMGTFNVAYYLSPLLLTSDPSRSYRYQLDLCGHCFELTCQHKLLRKQSRTEHNTAFITTGPS